MRIDTPNNFCGKKIFSNNSEQGFTLVEVFIALMILTTGLLAAVVVVTYALQTSVFSRNTTQSKMLMSAMLEQIETLRNTGQLTFNQIANEDQVENPPNGTVFSGFRADFVPIAAAPGVDGIFGTADDGAANAATAQYSRRVLITRVDPNIPTLRQVQVTVRYPSLREGVREISMVGYINDNQRSNQY